MKCLSNNLKNLGLSEYEAKTYLGLIKCNVSGATKLSIISGVPRTKIYSSLKSLQTKGWVIVYPTEPLLFKALHPKKVIERTKKDYIRFLDHILSDLNDEAESNHEKFVMAQCHLGMNHIKEDIRNAKSVWINNATTQFLEEIRDLFKNVSDLRIILFPGEEKISGIPAQFKEAKVKVVYIIKNNEIPMISMILNNERTFHIILNPLLRLYMINELFYENQPMFELSWENANKNTRRSVMSNHEKSDLPKTQRNGTRAKVSSGD